MMFVVHTLTNPITIYCRAYPDKPILKARELQGCLLGCMKCYNMGIRNEIIIKENNTC